MDGGDRLPPGLAPRVLVVAVGPHRARAGTAPARRRCRRSCPGRMLRKSCRIGPPSSWKTPRVSPRPSSAYAGGLSSGRSSRTRSIPRFGARLSSASSSTVRLRSPRKSILIRPEGLTGRVVELGDDRPVLLPAHDRDDVDQRPGGHDHPRCVHPPLPLQALQIPGVVDHRLDIRIRRRTGPGTPRPRRSACPRGRRCFASETSLPITGAGIALVIFSPTPNG